MTTPTHARLLQFRDLGPEVREFLFDLPGEERFDFTPGQFVSFSGVMGGKKVTRAYSIASRPGGNRFELCLNRVREGLMSPWLFELGPGGEIAVKGPFGAFVPRQPARDSVLVATGTGVAPFRSYLQAGDLLDQRRRVTLLFGTRYEEGILYREEFEGLASQNERFTYLPTLTRPGNTWGGRTGRVQQHLDEALGRRGDIDIYICGLRAMVDEVRERLKNAGYDRKQILSERFD
jgi:CDP-4-dehydro-6-deoxyglucose reductase